MTRWRLLVHEAGSGSWNMAVDQSLMETTIATGQPALRLYRWDRPTVSLGFGQRVSQEIDEDACRREGVPWVRRPTGGRVVLHHMELTYSVVSPEDYPCLPAGILGSYRFFSTALLLGLRGLGVEAQLTEGRQGPAKGLTAACFDSPSWYELVVSGRKLVGSAQMRQGGVILQHGSMMLDLDVGRFLGLLRFPSSRHRELTRRLLHDKATWLKREMEEVPPLPVIVDALVTGFAKQIGTGFDHSRLSCAEERRANALVINKFGNDQWTNHRKTACDR